MKVFFLKRGLFILKKIKENCNMVSLDRMIESNQSDQEWHCLRSGPWGIGIGSSDAGTICGLNELKTPLQFYWKKIVTICPEMNILFKQEETEKDKKNFDHGHKWEDYIAKHYSEITGNNIGPGNYWPHPKYPEVYGASPDRLIYNKSGKLVRVLEIKAPTKELYSEPKSEHIAQMMFQMWIVGTEEADYAVGFVSPDSSPDTETFKNFMIYTVKRSEEYISWMKRRLFYMTKCLYQRTPPDPMVYSLCDVPNVDFKKKYRVCTK